MPDALMGERELNFRSYLDLLRRRWRVVVGTTAALTVAAIALSMSQKPTYEAWSELLVDESRAEALVNSDPNAALLNLQNADRRLNNEVQALESGQVAAVVAAQYDGPLDPDDVTATVAGFQTDVIRVSVTASEPEEAAELVNTYVETYIGFRRQQRIDELAAASAEVDRQISDLTAQIDSLKAPLDLVDDQILLSPDDEQLAARRADLEARLAPELEPLESQRAFYQSLADDLSVSAGVIGSSGPDILTAATVPVDPVSPKPVRDGVLAGFVGLILGVVLAIVRDGLDETIRSYEDVSHVLPGVPSLASIPSNSVLRTTGRLDPEGSDAATEAFRFLRTSIRFLEVDRRTRVIQVTSSSAGEGKSTITANLARMLDQAGHSVAVVCCDMRRPRIHEYFEQTVSPGLADVLIGDAVLADAMCPVGRAMHLLPAGTRPPNPSELLGGARTERLIESLADKTEFVLIDTPPVLAVSDALVISQFTDATILVVAADSTTRRDLARTKEALDRAQADVVGVVMNRAGASSVNAYGYDYGASDRRRVGSTRWRRRLAASGE